MRILVTRPAEDGAALAARLTQMGHQILAAPLLQARWFDGAALDLTGIAAILATSANGVRALVRRTMRRDVSVFAVGPQTMAEALGAGFARVENADGDARALAEAVPRWLAPDAGVLLHVCGADNVGQLAENLGARGYAVRREILYAVDALTLPQAAARALHDGEVDAALFFSPRSARIFLEQTEGLPLAGVMAFCISPATAAVLPPDRFGAVRIAAMPNQDALLALF